jgi:hypothetical protein
MWSSWALAQIAVHHMLQRIASLILACEPLLNAQSRICKFLGERAAIELSRLTFWGSKKREKTKKTYNSWDSLVVTHPTTNQPACGLSTAERTGSPISHTLWSYVLVFFFEKTMSSHVLLYFFLLGSLYSNREASNPMLGSIFNSFHKTQTLSRLYRSIGFVKSTKVWIYQLLTVITQVRRRNLHNESGRLDKQCNEKGSSMDSTY